MDEGRSLNEAVSEETCEAEGIKENSISGEANETGEIKENGIDGEAGEVEEAKEARETREIGEPSEVRGRIIAPFGEFDARELAARKVRGIMGIA